MSAGVALHYLDPVTTDLLGPYPYGKQMYANSTTLHVGVSHARANLPQLIDLVERDEFDPLKVATLIADWDDAPDAFTTRTTKVIVRRKEFGRSAS